MDHPPARDRPQLWRAHTSDDMAPKHRAPANQNVYMEKDGGAVAGDAGPLATDEAVTVRETSSKQGKMASTDNMIIRFSGHNISLMV